MAKPIRIANCSGFYGDRMSAAREMVDGGPIDVLTGDWLAELTMLILAKNQQKDPDTGFAKTFVKQMDEVMGSCLDKGIRVVANAGGLAPVQCAEAVRTVAEKLGLSPNIAVVDGDNLLPRLDELRKEGLDLSHWETEASLGEREIMTANAYLGSWGIAAALERGADIVITGRVTDAAVVIGPAAWHHGWKRDNYDALAGALVAGHVIECGTQATGGNYCFFQEVPDLRNPGFPIAEIAEDGSSIITKHEDQGGIVSVGTVTAQLLYEISGPEYMNPDVSARFDTIRLTEEGSNRVKISHVRGVAPPKTLKVCINYMGGYRTTMTMLLTGLDIEAKAQVYESAFWAKFPQGRETFDEVDVQLLRTDHEDPESNGAAIALLRITVKDQNPDKVGRIVFEKSVELGLSNYPGLASLPVQTQAYGVYWPASVPSELVPQKVTLDGDSFAVTSQAPTSQKEDTFHPPEVPRAAIPNGETKRVPLGRIAGARSGDKGGNANVGFWTRTDEEYAWLEDYLGVERFKELMPEARLLEVSRYPLPGIRSINFVIHGALGEGVASSVLIDPQAKGLGEYLRAKFVDMPKVLLNGV